MKVWHHINADYPYLPPENEWESMRVTLPTRFMDPVRAAERMDMWIELFQEAERLGYGLMFNEHHQTAISLNPTAPLMAAAVARLTCTAPLLILGNPIANRPDPLRVAEEMAVLDLLSHGRLHCGFVRGVPFELSATNATPLRSTERFWEAHDLIIKAWTSHDGPFSWTGEFFEHRQVNVWPRPYQQPHPPVWITTLNPASTPPIADRGYAVATFLVGFDGARDIFQAYRARRRDKGLAEHGDHFAYAAILAVGATEEEGRRRAEQLMWFMRADKVATPFILPPGYVPPQARLDALAGVDTFHLRERSLDDLIEAGMAFAGRPDTVFAQIKRFHDYVGGFGHLLAIQHSGYLEQSEVVESMRLFAAEVMPRLDELDNAASGHAE